MFAINSGVSSSQYYDVVAGPLGGGSGTVLGQSAPDPVDSYTPSQPK